MCYMYLSCTQCFTLKNNIWSVNFLKVGLKNGQKNKPDVFTIAWVKVYGYMYMYIFVSAGIQSAGFDFGKGEMNHFKNEGTEKKNHLLYFCIIVQGSLVLIFIWGDGWVVSTVTWIFF